jgi:hypothetical protein
VGYDRDFQLLGPCQGCTIQKCKCDRVVPCSKCKQAGRMCEMSEIEVERRCTKLMGAVYGRTFPHVNVAIYELHQQGLMYDLGTLLKRADAKNVCKMLERFGGAGVRIEESNKVPSVLMDLVNASKYGRLEYMSHGHYSMVTTKCWSDEFMVFEDVCKTARRLKVIPKLVETLKLSDYTVGHRMWLESVMKPYTHIRWEGKIMSKAKGGSVEKVEVTMITAVLSSALLVTATSIIF